MSKTIKQNVLVITRIGESRDIKVDFDEGSLPLDLVLSIMESIIQECRSETPIHIDPKDIN